MTGSSLRVEIFSCTTQDCLLVLRESFVVLNCTSTSIQLAYMYYIFTIHCKYSAFVLCGFFVKWSLSKPTLVTARGAEIFVEKRSQCSTDVDDLPTCF